MEVFLVRHAKSAHDVSRWKTDAVRPLAEKGINRQKKSSIGMIREGIEFNTVWVSPFRRAQETLGIILNIYELNITPKIVEELKVWGDPKRVEDLLEKHYKKSPEDKLLLVGHNPNMSNLVENLTGDDIHMRTSDLVHIKKSGVGFELVDYYPRQELMKR